MFVFCVCVSLWGVCVCCWLRACDCCLDVFGSASALTKCPLWSIFPRGSNEKDKEERRAKRARKERKEREREKREKRNKERHEMEVTFSNVRGFIVVSLLFVRFRC